MKVCVFLAPFSRFQNYFSAIHRVPDDNHSLFSQSALTLYSLSFSFSSSSFLSLSALFIPFILSFFHSLIHLFHSFNKDSLHNVDVSGMESAHPSTSVVYQSDIPPAKSFLLGRGGHTSVSRKGRAEHCGHAQDLLLRAEEGSL